MDNSLLGQKSPWTKVSLDKSPLDNSLPWTIAPWTIVPTPSRQISKIHQKKYCQMILVLRQLSKGRLSKETFVRGDFCPRRLLSKETFVQGMFVQGTFVQGDFCPRRLLSKETFVQGDYCPRRHLSKQTFVQNCPRTFYVQGNLLP